MSIVSLPDGGTRGLVGVEGHRGVIWLILQPAQRHGVSGAVPGQPDGELAIVGGNPHPVMHVKSRVRPGEHAVRRLDIHEFPAHEQTQHCPSKGLGACCDIVQRQRHEGAVRPEPAIGNQQIAVRVPVGRRTVGLVDLFRPNDYDTASPWCGTVEFGGYCYIPRVHLHGGDVPGIQRQVDIGARELMPIDVHARLVA